MTTEILPNSNSTYQTVKPPDGFLESSGSVMSSGRWNDSELYGEIGDQSSGWVPYWDKPTTIILSIVIIILIVVSLVGNSLVISVIIRHRGMRTRTNMFLMNLAVADFLVGFIPMPFSLITLINGRWIFSHSICVMNGFFNGLCLFTSNQLLMYISIHKYFSFTRPFSKFLTFRKIWCMIAAAWLYALLCSILTVTGLQRVEYKNGTMQCGPAYPRDVFAYIHHGLIQITELFIPFAVMIFCYIRIFIEMRHHAQRMRKNTTVPKDTILTQQKKVTITMFIVLACFVCCWLPYHLYASYVSYKKNRDYPPIINAVAYTFGFLNSACNPIIYALRSESFRKGYMEILCRNDTEVLSEDTLPSDSASFRDRFSSLIGSLRGSKVSRTGSEVSRDRVPSVKDASPPAKNGSLKSFQRALSKGSSIIRKNDSIVIMKHGKIVCVKPTGGKLVNKKPWSKKAAILEGEEIRETEIDLLLENGHSLVLQKDSGFQYGNLTNVQQDSLYDLTNNDDVFSSSMSSATSFEHCPHDNNSTQSLPKDGQCVSKSASNLTSEAERPEVQITIYESPDVTKVKLPISRSTEQFDLGLVIPFSLQTKRLTKSDQCLDKEERKRSLKRQQESISNSARGKITKPKDRRLLRLPSVEHLDIRPAQRRKRPSGGSPKAHAKSSSPFTRKSWFFGSQPKPIVLKPKKAHSIQEI